MNERASYSEISAQIKARYDRSIAMLWLHGNLRETARSFDRRPKFVLSIFSVAQRATPQTVEAHRAFVARQMSCHVRDGSDRFPHVIDCDWRAR
jgi:hypothetical protein